ncbi:MAG: response regulator [Rhodoferax sp.]|nr:response regulator [Rhodoferax sp.]MCF8210823.1 response regulator [Rhodoferax sp.]
MNTIIWVNVLGFSDVERHALNAIFRLSALRETAYALWTPEAPAAPAIALIDGDSYEGGLELASPRLNSDIKVIYVGSEPPDPVWRSIGRPVDWSAVLQVMDSAFVAPSNPAPDAKVELDFDLDLESTQYPGLLQGVRVSLLVGMTREDRMYLRSRMALAGLTDVDEAETVLQAQTLLKQRVVGLVVVSLELSDTDPWEFVRSLQHLATPPKAIVVVTEKPSGQLVSRAEQSDCLAVLEIPFSPQHVVEVLLQM